MNSSNNNKTTVGAEKKLAEPFLTGLRNRDRVLLRQIIEEDVVWSLPRRVAKLAGSVAEFPATTRAFINVVGKNGDADPADLFEEVFRRVDKYGWSKRAYNQTIRKT
jgi:hypothetical protein